MERRICAIGIHQAARAVLRAEESLGHPLSLLRATAIEHLGELLPLARRADVDAHLHRERDRRAEGVELRVGCCRSAGSLHTCSALPWSRSRERRTASDRRRSSVPSRAGCPGRAAADPPRRAGSTPRSSTWRAAACRTLSGLNETLRFALDVHGPVHELRSASLPSWFRRQSLAEPVLLARRSRIAVASAGSAVVAGL